MSPVTVVNHESNGKAVQGNEKTVEGDEKAVETKWSWVVLVAIFCNAVVVFGQLSAMNIYYVVFLREFGASKAYTAWIPASYSTALCVIGPLASVLLPRLGPRLMIIISVLLYTTSLALISMANSIPYLIVLFAVNGGATTMIQTGHLATLSAYFPRRFYLATGIVYAGVGLGTIIIGLEVEWAIKEFGWRGAMIIQGGVVLHACVGGSLIFPVKRKTNKSSSCKPAVIKSPAVSPLVYFKDLRYWLLVLCMLTLYWTLMAVGAMSKNLTVSYGLEDHFWLCLIMSGLGQMIGRLMAGFIAQHFFEPPIYYALTSVGTALLCIAYIYARVPWAIVATFFGYGLLQGQQIVIIFLQMAWVYGHQQAAIVRGYIFLFSIIASFSSAPLTGWTVDVTKSYDMAMYIATASCLTSGVCGVVIYITQRRRKAKEDNAYAIDVWTHF